MAMPRNWRALGLGFRSVRSRLIRRPGWPGHALLCIAFNSRSWWTPRGATATRRRRTPTAAAVARPMPMTRRRRLPAGARTAPGRGRRGAGGRGPHTARRSGPDPPSGRPATAMDHGSMASGRELLH